MAQQFLSFNESLPWTSGTEETEGDGKYPRLANEGDRGDNKGKKTIYMLYTLHVVVSNKIY